MIFSIGEKLSKNEVKTLEVLLDFRGEKIKNFCQERFSRNADPYKIFDELSICLEKIGEGFEKKKYFTSDLIVSGKNMKKAIEILKPYFKIPTRKKGKVLMGTVKGDVHDIGKGIFAIMLESNGFDVIDLGVDVDKESFVEQIRKNKPDILGMSALLTTTISYMEEVVKELREEKLRDKIKIIIGGYAVSKEFADKIGVEYGKDSLDGLKKSLKFMEAKN